MDLGGISLDRYDTHGSGLMLCHVCITIRAVLSTKYRRYPVADGRLLIDTSAVWLVNELRSQVVNPVLLVTTCDDCKAKAVMQARFSVLPRRPCSSR